MAEGKRGIWQTVWQGAVCLALVLGVLFYSDIAKAGITKGLVSCYRVIIPALFPFMVISNIIMNSRVSLVLRALFRPVSKYLFRSSAAGGAIFPMAMLGGFPVGPKLVRGALDSGQITEREAKRLTLFCFNAAPAFVITGVGTGMFGSVAAGGWLYVSSVLSCLLLGTIFGQISGRGRAAQEKQRGERVKEPEFKPFSVVFVESIQSATSSLLAICGNVIVFAALLHLIESVLPMSPTVATAVSGLAEITAGSMAAGAMGGTLGLTMAAFFIGFCGISAISQLQLCTGSLVAFGKVVLARLCCGGMTAGIFTLLWKLVPPAAADAWVVAPSPDISGITNSPATAVLLLLFFLSVIIQLSSRSGRLSRR